MTHEGEYFSTSEGKQFTTRDKVIDLVSDYKIGSDDCSFGEMRQWAHISVHESVSRMGVGSGSHWPTIELVLGDIDNVVTNTLYWRLANSLMHKVTSSYKSVRCSAILKVLQR